LGARCRSKPHTTTEPIIPELIEFARDHAFLDGMSHQGNDFQITSAFWNQLNELTREYNADGSFIIFPGYEWSGNTGLGGDRNVLFLREGQQIHRSSHALVDDQADLLTDANSAEQLFEALKNKDCVVFAHIGGRYADIKKAHDARIERSVEVHSDWRTFEWLLRDAAGASIRRFVHASIAPSWTASSPQTLWRLANPMPSYATAVARQPPSHTLVHDLVQPSTSAGSSNLTAGTRSLFQV
jgi:hypothetical protein